MEGAEKRSQRLGDDLPERESTASCVCAESAHDPPTPSDDHAFKLKVTFCVRGVISPLLSNVYLTEVDAMVQRAKAVTRHQPWTYVEYARFADDLVVLVDAHPRQRWLRTAVEQRLREELPKPQVEVNEEKSRRGDLTHGESFGFLGFEVRLIRSRRGRWMPLRTPRGKKRTALLQTLEHVFRRHRSRPIAEVIARINPIQRGWVQYFAFGHSSRCFSYLRDGGSRIDMPDHETH